MRGGEGVGVRWEVTLDADLAPSREMLVGGLVVRSVGRGYEDDLMIVVVFGEGELSLTGYLRGVSRGKGGSMRANYSLIR